MKYPRFEKQHHWLMINYSVHLLHSAVKCLLKHRNGQTHRVADVGLYASLGQLPSSNTTGTFLWTMMSYWWSRVIQWFVTTIAIVVTAATFRLVVAFPPFELALACWSIKVADPSPRRFLVLAFAHCTFMKPPLPIHSSKFLFVTIQLLLLLRGQVLDFLKFFQSLNFFI